VLTILVCGGVSHCGVFRLPEPEPSSGAEKGVSWSAQFGGSGSGNRLRQTDAARV